MNEPIDPPIDITDIRESGIAYPNVWVPLVRTCECGVQVRTDVEMKIGGVQIGGFYQHCGKDNGRAIPPLIAVWELIDNKWHLVKPL